MVGSERGPMFPYASAHAALSCRLSAGHQRASSPPAGRFGNAEQAMAAIQARVQEARAEPGQLTDDWWLFQDTLYLVNGPTWRYSHEQLKLLVFDAFDSERRKFERLRNRFAGAAGSGRSRPGIAEQVRIDVWRRDGGKCARCGSREKLEYDHIVPLSQGGSNTARNIELLCEQCNRSKGGHLA
jgi:hypothetical protein